MYMLYSLVPRVLCYSQYPSAARQASKQGRSLTDPHTATGRRLARPEGLTRLTQGVGGLQDPKWRSGDSLSQPVGYRIRRL
jgi:hypothetical protein